MIATLGKRYDAVIFDFYGTLVNVFSFRTYEAMITEMAELFAADRDAFQHHWVYESWENRAIGKFKSAKENALFVCEALSLEYAEEMLEAAERLNLAWGRENAIAHEGAVETLAALKERGYRIGLISDCSWEVPILWPELPFAPFVDVPTFSCVAGMRKPDPRIYLRTCESLGVPPERCVYVGDGSSHELTGAAAVGMTPILIQVPYHDTYDPQRPDAEGWAGLAITRPPELLDLLDRLQAERETERLTDTPAEQP
jgi:putative hydrolase of the HAD superfamily